MEGGDRWSGGGGAAPAVAGAVARGERPVLDSGAALGAQLRQLLQGLGREKESFHAAMAEVQRLHSTFGDAAVVQLLRQLLAERAQAAADGREHPEGPESLRLQMLGELLCERLPEMPNFISVASDSLGGLVQPAGGPIAASPGAVSGFLATLARVAKLPAAAQLCLSLALCHASSAATRRGALGFLKQKLAGLTAPRLAQLRGKGLPDHALRHLLFLCGGPHWSERERVLWAAELQDADVVRAFPLDGSRLDEMKHLGDDLSSSQSLAAVMDELGPACTATEKAFQVVAALFPRLPDAAVGRAIGVMAINAEAPSADTDSGDAHADLQAAFGGENPRPAAAAAKRAAAWSPANFVRALRQTHPSVDWNAALRGLDFKGLADAARAGRLHARSLGVVLQCYRLCPAGSAKGELPLSALLGPWEHPEAQLALIALCLRETPPEGSVSFATPRMVPQQGEGDEPEPWRSVDMVEALLDIAGSGDAELQQRVEALWSTADGSRDAPPALRCTEELLMAAAQASPRCGAKLQSKLLSRLMGMLLLQPRRLREALAPLQSSPAGSECRRRLMCAAADCADQGGPSAARSVAQEIGAAAVSGGWLEDALSLCPSPHVVAALAVSFPSQAPLPGWVGSVLQVERKAACGVGALGGTLIRQLLATQPCNLAASARPLLAYAEFVGRAQGAPAQLKAEAEAAVRLIQGAASQPHPQPAEAEMTEFPADVEHVANGHFSRVYSNKEPVAELLESMTAWRDSADPRDRQILFCVIHNLFDEFRYVHKYPLEALLLTAELLGGIIVRRLLTRERLGVALSFIYHSLARTEASGVAESSLHIFSARAVSEFEGRLPEWDMHSQALRMLPGAAEAAKHAAGAGDPAPAQPAPQQQLLQVPNAGRSQSEIAAMLLQRRPQTPQPDPSAVERITFWVNNLDAGNVDARLGDIRALLRPEHYVWLADYVVTMRAALEPNFHKVYLSLLDHFDSREVDQAVLQATLGSVKALLDSETVRTSSHERSVLKHLGCWLGLQTIAKNKPIMARDLNIKELLFSAIPQGRLIAAVPFVAKVLEQCVGSRVFRPPNPWLMAIIALLVDIYVLPDLKLTLRFEVEVLCKNLQVSIDELVASRASRDVQQQRIAELLAHVDLSNSPDFHAKDQAATAVSAQMPQGEDAEWAPHAQQPRGAMPVAGGGGLLQQISGWVDGGEAQRAWIRHTPTPAPVDIAKSMQLPPALLAAPELNLQLAAALRQAVSDHVQTVGERSAVIACTATREIALKDLVNETDDARLRRAAQLMVRNLAAQLATVTCRDVLRATLRGHFKQVLRSAQLGADEGQVGECAEGLVGANLGLAVRMIAQAAVEEAAQRMDQALAATMQARIQLRQSGRWSPGGDAAEDLLGEDHRGNIAYVKALPDMLRPRSAMMLAHWQVYEDFARQTEPPSELQQRALRLDRLLLQIEQKAAQHYAAASSPEEARRLQLSLTTRDFHTATKSAHHEAIRQLLLQIPSVFEGSLAPQLAKRLLLKLIPLTDRIEHGRTAQGDCVVYVAMLVRETILYALKHVSEWPGVAQAIMQAYLSHDRRWRNLDLATNLIRLQLVDTAEFDEGLAAALTPEPPQGAVPRWVADAAGHIIRALLVEEKLVSQRAMKQTLQALERVAKMRQSSERTRGAPTAPQQAAAQPAAPQPCPAAAGPAPAPAAPAAAAGWQGGEEEAEPDGAAEEVPSLQPPLVNIPSLVTSAACREQIFALFQEWVGLCAQKRPGGAAGQGMPPQQQQMRFVGKLQQADLLRADQNLDPLLCLLMEFGVADFCSAPLREASRRQHGPRPGGQSAAPHFLAVDCFSDLVIVLTRCLCWGTQQGAKPKDGEPDPSRSRNVAAEVALLDRVLARTGAVLLNLHDEYMRAGSAPPDWAKGLPQGHSFVQRPFFRFYSNLLSSIGGPVEGAAGAEHPGELIMRCAAALCGLAPSRAPGFAFAWFELVTHKSFMPRLLHSRAGWLPFHRLLLHAFRFLDLALRGPFTEAVSLFCKGTLKLLLVLYHDFPDFLVNLHYTMCDVIPHHCVQLRNIVLAACPRGVSFPDPYSPDLRIEQVPDIAKPPQYLAAFTAALGAGARWTGPAVTLEELQKYLRTRQPQGFPLGLAARLRHPDEHTGHNLPALNAVVFACAVETLEAHGNSGPIPRQAIESSAAMEVYRKLAAGLSPTGRYHFLNAMANQLRFPNLHTHFFSCALILLFVDPAGGDLSLQEQITRVLLERLIAHRPHPWGLVVTFVELIKSRECAFWEKPFIHTSPEIAQLFDQVGRSCVGVQALVQPRNP